MLTEIYNKAKLLIVIKNEMKILKEKPAFCFFMNIT